MKRYRCAVCGYVYDEATGDPDRGIMPGTRFSELPVNWVCPICGATKSAFSEEAERTERKRPKAGEKPIASGENAGLLSALCSNLSRGCEKQYRTEESELWMRLAEYYHDAQEEKRGSFEMLAAEAAQDAEAFAEAKDIAAENGDRGALRALVWAEKTTAAVRSLLDRYQKEGDALLENTKIFVCEICGFLYVGDEPPEICPVCKVPKLKITEVGR